MSSSAGILEAPRGVHRLAVVLVFATFVLLIAGGQVTSTESGDAVPTWPFPLVMEMSQGVTWELGHRQVAGTVGLLTLALWIVALLRARHHPKLVKLASFALLLVIFQAALGGVRVLVGANDPRAGTALESWSVRAIAITHASVAQLFLLFTVTLAAKSSAAWLRGGPHLKAGVRRAAFVMVVTTYLQIVLGAVVRHTMSGVGLLIHVAGAGAVLVAGAQLAAKILGTHSPDSLRRPALGLALALLFQIFLGVASWVLVNRGIARSYEITLQAVIPTLHLVTGGAILALAHLCFLRAGWRLAPIASRQAADSASKLALEAHT